MFTEQFLQKIEQSFKSQMERLGSVGTQVDEVLLPCSEQEAQALKCLYASMPVSDAADYPAGLFYSYAKHGAFLWEKGPFAGKVPEQIFAGYVLHHRVNNEDITDSRPFFYEQLKERIKNKTMQEAVLEINYWCASQAAYRTTDQRTASAACVCRSAYGRCGEESTFLVTVLRSMGIPARQVYVPLWSHCDDNHAWVEAWCDGAWKFLGACEPEEILNKGWFTNASSRAMMVHSRWLLPAAPEDDVVGKSGMSLVLNQLKRYAYTTRLAVTVLDENGVPVPGVKLCFEVLNYACFGKVAQGQTGEDGTCVLETGLGSVHVTACHEGRYGEILVDTQEQPAGTLILGQTGEKENEWEEMGVYAPKDAPINRCEQSAKEIEHGREKQKEAVRARQEKEKKFFDEVLAERAAAVFSGEEKKRCINIMRQARGNQGEIADFLTRDTKGEWPERFKLQILESLREKDYLDITADILEEHCKETAEYADKYTDEILIPFVLCPRVDNEMIRPYRSFLKAWLSGEEKDSIKREPFAAVRMVEERLLEDSSLEYENLITSAQGALLSGYGSSLTKKAVCVQILRTLGIPARLHPADQTLEYFKDGVFITQSQRETPEKGRSAGVIIQRQEEKPWVYFQNWSMARYEEDGYHTLSLCDESGTEIYGEIPLFPGKYRILTANRLPNGNIFASRFVFTLKEDEKRSILLKQMEAQPSDMLADHDISDFVLLKEDGTACRASELVKDRMGLFIWLEESKEPTEHILNEIYERREAFGRADTDIYFVIPDLKAKENPTLARALAGVTGVRVLLDNFGADMEVLARRMYLEPGKLPLIVLINESMRGVYGSAGYNVGTADMILKLLNMQK